LNSFVKFLEFNQENNLTSDKNASILFLIKDANNPNNINSSLENLSLENTLKITLNSKLLNYAIKSNGRLDIYAKAHFFLSLFSALENKNANLRSKLKNLEVLKDFETMEKDLLNTISMGEAEKFTKSKFDALIEKLVENLIARNNETKIIRDLKKLLVLYQNINDQESLKYVENILVKLMGHPEVFLSLFFYFLLEKY
jgi:hypothetical protein